MMKKTLLRLVLSTALLALPSCSSPTGSTDCTTLRDVPSEEDGALINWGTGRPYNVATFRNVGYTCRLQGRGRYYTCTRCY